METLESSVGGRYEHQAIGRSKHQVIEASTEPHNEPLLDLEELSQDAWF